MMFEYGSLTKFPFDCVLGSSTTREACGRLHYRMRVSLFALSAAYTSCAAKVQWTISGTSCVDRSLCFCGFIFQALRAQPMAIHRTNVQLETLHISHACSALSVDTLSPKHLPAFVPGSSLVSRS